MMMIVGIITYRRFKYWFFDISIGYQRRLKYRQFMDIVSYFPDCLTLIQRY